MTKSGERGRDRPRDGPVRPLRTQAAVAEVGCYLTILVKRFAALYNRPRSRVTERVTDRERCQASHSDCLHRAEADTRFRLPARSKPYPSPFPPSHLLLLPPWPLRRERELTRGTDRALFHLEKVEAPVFA